MELYVTDDPRLFLSIPLMATVFIALLARLAFYGELRRALPGLSLYMSMVSPYLEYQYLSKRPKVGSRRLDILLVAMSSALSLAAICGVLLWRALSVSS